MGANHGYEITFLNLLITVYLPPGRDLPAEINNSTVEEGGAELERRRSIHPFASLESGVVTNGYCLID